MQNTGWTRVAAVVALTLGLIYGVKLADLARKTYKAEQAAQLLAAQVEVLGQQVVAFETAAVEAGTDDYAERYARENLDMQREGDRPFVPVQADTAPEAAPDEAPAEPSAWQRFLRWVRGESEPATSSPEPPTATSTP